MNADECRLVVILMGMKFGISLSPNVHFLSPNLRQVGKRHPRRPSPGPIRDHHEVIFPIGSDAVAVPITMVPAHVDPARVHSSFPHRDAQHSGTAVLRSEGAEGDGRKNVEAK